MSFHVVVQAVRSFAVASSLVLVLVFAALLSFAGPAAEARSAHRCANANLMPRAGNLALVDQAALCLVNRQRRLAGRAPLAESVRLDRAAQGHSDDMVARSYFDHVSPGGSDPVRRMFNVGFLNANVGYAIGENIAWGTRGFATPASIVVAWMRSPRHRANMLDASFRQTGIGISPSAPGSEAHGHAGATYTQDFATVTH